MACAYALNLDPKHFGMRSSYFKFLLVIYRYFPVLLIPPHPAFPCPSCPDSVPLPLSLVSTSSVSSSMITDHFSYWNFLLSLSSNR